jgi:DNA gyrase inhibitor GyrI
MIGETTPFIALYHDDPQSVPEKELRADAGLTVPPEVEPADGVRILDLPAMRCAVPVFSGP